MALIKQYVNLPSGTTNIHGSTRQIRVAPTDVPSVPAGAQSEWWVEPDGATNVNLWYINPATRNPVSPSGPAGAKMRSTPRPLTSSGANAGFFVNTLELPPVGGDNYVVKVSRRGNRVQHLTTPDTFQTWRKLYYTVYYMGAAQLAMFNGLEARFRDAFSEGFLELENVAKIATLTEMARANLTSNWTTRSFPWMSGGAGALMNLRPNGTGTLRDKPFHIAILVVPELYELSNVPRTQTNQTNVAGATFFLHDLHTDAATTLAFIDRATVSWTGQAPINVRNRFTLGPHSPNGSTIMWDLSGVAGLTRWLATPGHRFNLAYTVRREDTFMGWSWANFCVVRTVDGETDVLQTFTHELGHNCQQTTRRENRWDEAGNPMSPDNNPLWHTDNFGGQGPHCSYRAVLGAASPAQVANGATSGQTYRWGGSGDMCTMFFRGDRHVDPLGKFCAVECQPRLRRVDLSAPRMTARNWNFFG